MRVLVKRYTLSNECYEFTFTEQKEIRAFSVKNLGTSDVIADFETITDTSTQGVLIPGGHTQTVVYTLKEGGLASNKIYVKGSGLVEVQAVWF